jgi:spermidine/putrescine transport system ATP-binding protein
MSLLEIRNVSRRFGDFTAVDQVSLAIEAGEFFTLLGRQVAARPRCRG